jgi:hypothetical protein
MQDQRDVDVIDSRGGADQPVTFNERTWRALVRRVAWYAAVACAGGIAFAGSIGWSNWGLYYWLFLWFAGWLSNTLAATEWTIAGRELGRRRWFSWPGSKPSKLMELGPDVEAVHETRYRWRVWPNVIFVAPWQARRLVEALERADVHVNDWRADWAQRHRLLNAFGAIAYYGGAVGMFVSLALLPLPRPGSGPSTGAFLAPVGAVVLCLAAIVLGWAIDYLPWSMRKPSA